MDKKYIERSGDQSTSCWPSALFLILGGPCGGGEESRRHFLALSYGFVVEKIPIRGKSKRVG